MALTTRHPRTSALNGLTNLTLPRSESVWLRHEAHKSHADEAAGVGPATLTCGFGPSAPPSRRSVRPDCHRAGSAEPASNAYVWPRYPASARAMRLVAKWVPAMNRIEGPILGAARAPMK